MLQMRKMLVLVLLSYVHLHSGTTMFREQQAFQLGGLFVLVLLLV